MTLAADRYRQLMTELLLLRLEAGGPLAQIEEVRFTGALDRCWRVMSEAEQDAVDEEFAPVLKGRIGME